MSWNQVFEPKFYIEILRVVGKWYKLNILIVFDDLQCEDCRDNIDYTYSSKHKVT